MWPLVEISHQQGYVQSSLLCIFNVKLRRLEKLETLKDNI